MSRLSKLICLLLALVAPTAFGGETSSKHDVALVGHYYLEGGSTDVGSELLLSASGQFEWSLMYGAVDYAAKGTWQKIGKRLVLSPLSAPEPVFRMFGASDYHSTKPAEPGLWIAIVGVPNLGPVADIEVRFESRSGKAITAASKANGDAIVEMPANEVWARAGLRQSGSAAPWQWFNIVPERARARLAGFALTNLDAVQHAPFTSLTLEVKSSGLVINDRASRLRGTYTKH